MGRTGSIEFLGRNMATKRERDELVAAIVKVLYDAGADQWSIQDKGVLLAAIKLALRKRRP